MRALVAVVVILVVMFALGWLYVRNTGRTTEFVIDKQEIRSDTDAAVRQGKKLLHEATKEAENLGKESPAPLNEAPNPDEAPSAAPQTR